MLKVKFWRIENVVLMKVLEQSGKTKNRRGYYLNIQSHIRLHFINRFAIDVYDSEAIIYIDTANNIANNKKVVSYDFSSVDEAKDFYNRAVQTIKDYNHSIDSVENTEETQIELTIAE